MSLIVIKNKNVADLPSLIRLTLRFIYEREKMMPSDFSLLEQSLKGWEGKIRLDKQLNRDPDIIENESIVLFKCIELINKNERGELDARKKLFKEKNIDWRKFHRLPEAYTAADFERGQKLIEEYERIHPEFKTITTPRKPMGRG